MRPLVLESGGDKTQHASDSDTALGSGYNWLLQLLVLSICVGFGSAVIGLLLPKTTPVPDAVADALVEGFVALVGVGIACHAWIRFAAEKRFGWLGAALAASTFTTLTIAHTAITFLSAGRPGLTLAADWTIPVCRIAVPLCLIAGILTKRTLNRHWELRTYAKVAVLWGALIACILLALINLGQAAAPFVANSSRAPAYVIRVGPHILAATICLLATAAFARRSIAEHSGLHRLACLWLLPTSLSSAIRGVCFLDTGRLYWQANLLDAAAAGILAIGLSVHTANSLRHSNEQLNEVHAMHEISFAMAGAANMGSMLSAFVEVLAKTTQAKLAALYLLAQDPETLRLEAVYGDHRSILEVGATYSLRNEPRPGFHSGHTISALKERTAQIVEDVCSDVEFLPWQVVAQSNGWVVSAPIINRNDPIGVVNVYLDEKRSNLTQRVNLLEVMAALVAPAIENRRSALILAEMASDEMREAA